MLYRVWSYQEGEKVKSLVSKKVFLGGLPPVCTVNAVKVALHCTALEQ